MGGALENVTCLGVGLTLRNALPTARDFEASVSVPVNTLRYVTLMPAVEQQRDSVLMTSYLYACITL